MKNLKQTHRLIDALNMEIARVEREATVRVLRLKDLISELAREEMDSEQLSTSDAQGVAMAGKKVVCPFCSFRGSSHGSMVVHFGNEHPAKLKQCPPKSSWGALLVLGLLFFTGSLAHAGASPMTCYKACKVLNQESKVYRCDLAMDGSMIVDIVGNPTDKDELRLSAIRDCYFSAGGSGFELHGKDPKANFKSCSPNVGADSDRIAFACDSMPASSSVRKLGMLGDAKKKAGRK